MSARLTVVLDGEDLYRELKVRAAEEGVTLKVLIQRALREYLQHRPEPKLVTPEILEEWFAEADAMDRELPPDTPADLSDVKHHLYGWPRRALRVAEDPADYDA
jgi:hypothetical protein